MDAFVEALVAAAEAELAAFAGRKETNAGVAPLLTAYWTDGAGREAEAVAAEIANRTAWSAAFISFVVGKALAAAGSKADFDFSDAHAVYAGAAIRNRLAGIAAPVFLGLPPRGEGAVAPAVGDLVGSIRERAVVNHVDAVAKASAAGEDARRYASHFDVVVAAGGGTIETIGGNVSDNVRRRTVTLDRYGLLPQRSFTFGSKKPDVVTSGPWICIVRHLPA